MSHLTPKQEQVLTLLAEGCTVTAAAEQTGIHRNTIANWRRAYPEFQDTLAAAQFEHALYWRERLLAFGDRALQTLTQVFDDPNASPGVRLRAAMSVLDRIMKPALAQPEFASSRRRHRDLESALLESLEPPLSSTFVMEQIAHEHAALQTSANSATVAQSCTTPSAEGSAHRTFLRNRTSDPGRNAPCPCGSGFKYKRCCLSKQNIGAQLPARAA